MAELSIQSETLDEIAKKLRETNGTTAKMTPLEMPTEIDKAHNTINDQAAVITEQTATIAAQVKTIAEMDATIDTLNSEIDAAAALADEINGEVI